MQLRDYQRECIEKIDGLQFGSYLVQMATGLGKTVTFANIPRKGRVLLLSHRDELVHQPVKYYDCPVGIECAAEHSNGEEVVSASVQSLVRRLDRFKPNDFDMIITDECFPSSVKVDGKPLNLFRNGDIITSYNSDTGKIEKNKVIHVFKRKPSAMVVVTLENGQKIPCTPNHPFYVLGRGYIPAEKMEGGYYVRKLFMHELRNLCNERELHKGAMESKNGPIEERRKNLLFFGMLKGVSKKNLERNNGKNKPKICKPKNERKQSDEKKGNQRKSFKTFKGNRTLPKNQMWKWNRAYSSATKPFDCAERFRTLCRISGNNQICGKVRNTISGRIQSGYSNTQSDDSNRGGRKQSSCVRKAVSRQEKRILFEYVRVESVEIQEPTSDGTFGGLCPDGSVYNLEVEKNHNYFADGVLVHNCHHSAAKSYKKIYDYFKPRLHIGFSATPNRSDGVRLDDIYQDIIFQRDLKWAIKNGYLSDIRCLRANIGYDLSKVARRMGDFAPGELEKAMNIEGQNDAIAQVYREQAVGQTLIFAVSVAHAKAIAEKIPGAVVVDAKTKNRAEIIERFTRREIPALVNCMIFTEGTDMPLIETIIMARPTTSNALYTQMVGRGLRLSPGKDKLTLIDCVGVTGTRSLCSAPSLIGVDISDLPPKLQNEVQGDLFDLPEIAELKADNPASWIRNIEIVDLWAKEEEIDLHDVNWFKMPNGDLILSLPGNKLKIPAPDVLGETVWNGQKMKMQAAVDEAFKYLAGWEPDNRYIWDLKQAKRWGKAPASDKQKELVKRKCKNADIDIDSLTKLQASQILNRIFGDRK